MRGTLFIASVIFVMACNSSASPPSNTGSVDAGTDAASAGDAAVSADDANEGEEVIALPRNAIVFAAVLDGQEASDVYVVENTAVPRVTRLTQTAGAELYPTISPDRKSIAFVRDFQLFVIDADGGNERRVAAKTGRERTITPAGGSPFVYSTTLGPAAWSPDGKRLAYLYPRNPWLVDKGDEIVDSSGATTIHIVNADGTGDRAVPNLGDSTGYTINSIDWGPGETLTFMITCDAPDCAGGMWCATIKTDGSGWREIRFLRESQPAWPRKQIAWSPDNSLWLFVNYASVAGNADAYEQPGMLARSSPFTDNLLEYGVIGWGPRWNLDGDGFAYIADDGVYVTGVFEEGPRHVVTVTGVRGLDW
jgi:hypothetical protein